MNLNVNQLINLARLNIEYLLFHFENFTRVLTAPLMAATVSKNSPSELIVLVDFKAI
jgi:hypothetical protein